MVQRVSRHTQTNVRGVQIRQTKAPNHIANALYLQGLLQRQKRSGNDATNRRFDKKLL
jgi:hypothetical protein